MNLPDLKTALTQAWSQQTRQLKPSYSGLPRNYVYASGIHGCARSMYYDMAGSGPPEDLPDDARERMLAGDVWEREIANRLGALPNVKNVTFRRSGEQQAVQVKDRDGKLLLSGKVDGFLEVVFEVESADSVHTPIEGIATVEIIQERKDALDAIAAQVPWAKHCGITPGGYLFRARIPYEIKFGQVVARADSLEDLQRSSYGKKYVLQFLSYLLALGTPVGLLILVQPGGPRFLWVKLEDHLQETEEALKRVRVAIDGIESKEPPDFTKDQTLCARCRHFGRQCFPSVDYGAGAVILSEEVDTEVSELARILERTDEAATEYGRADKRLKALLRGVELAVFSGGRFQANGKWQRDTKYDIPADVKKQYGKEVEQGKFILKVTRLAPDGEAD